MSDSKWNDEQTKWQQRLGSEHTSEATILEGEEEGEIPAADRRPLLRIPTTAG